MQGQIVSQEKTFWEIPKAVSLAEKNSRPKPPGSGSKSVLRVRVWDQGLHKSGGLAGHAGPPEGRAG